MRLTNLPWQGMKVRVHALFWVVIFSAVLMGQFIEVITLFVLVVIHELGHVTAAWSFGWRIRSLELLPFGGVAKTDEWGTVPAHEEIVVALAGPFHNVMMVLVGYLFFAAGWWSEEWTTYFIQGNTMLAGFNLLPIYPLDGGRVLQAVLSYRLPYRCCITGSLTGGFISAVALLAWGLFDLGGGINLNLVVIAVFLCHANWAALKQKEFQYVRFLMHKKAAPIPDDSRVVQLVVRPDERLLNVVKRWYKEAYHVLIVKDRTSGQMVAIPEEAVLHRYFDERDPRCTVGELLR